MLCREHQSWELQSPHAWPRRSALWNTDGNLRMTGRFSQSSQGFCLWEDLWVLGGATETSGKTGQTVTQNRNRTLKPGKAISVTEDRVFQAYLYGGVPWDELSHLESLTCSHASPAETYLSWNLICSEVSPVWVLSCAKMVPELRSHLQNVVTSCARMLPLDPGSPS